MVTAPRWEKSIPHRSTQYATALSRTNDAEQHEQVSLRGHGHPGAPALQPQPAVQVRAPARPATSDSSTAANR